MKIAKALIVPFIAIAFVQCRKDNALRHNADLTNEPLEAIKADVKGRWELQRISGGFCGVCEHPVVNNPYMVLSSDHVTIGDASGVLEDGPITWQPATYFGSGFVFTTPSGMGLVPRAIVNDTLQLEQYAADGVTLHYTRSR